MTEIRYVHFTSKFRKVSFKTTSPQTNVRLELIPKSDTFFESNKIVRIMVYASNVDVPADITVFVADRDDAANNNTYPFIATSFKQTYIYTGAFPWFKDEKIVLNINTGTAQDFIISVCYGGSNA